MTPPVFPDVADDVKLILRHALSAHGIDCTVTNDIPESWRPGSRPHLAVFSDGIARAVKRAAAWPTVRVLARAATRDDPTGYGETRRLAIQAQGLLLAHPGGGGVASVRPLLGVLEAAAPDTGHPTAWFTVRCSVRAVPFDSF